MKKLQISVIIPVYNAEAFLENAVNSALQHDCVKEIILVEDASPDNALSICKELEQKHNRIKVYQHPNRENRGAGASRNLGIEKATSEYVAFLDADDWYLPNRFDAEKELLKGSSIDGVYGATGFYYEDKKEKDPNRLTTFEKIVEPEDLLHEITRSNGGRFTTDAITVKKSLAESIGKFDTDLRLHQDSHLWVRLAYYGSLVSGIISEPIAYRRVHSNNRISKANRASAYLFHKKIYDEFKNDSSLPKNVARTFFKNIIINQTNSNSTLVRGLIALKEIIAKPSILKKII